MAQSYKIFINDVLLLITETEDNSLPNPYYVTEEDFLADVPGTMSLIYENRSGQSCIIHAASAGTLLAKIKSKLRVIVAAGGLVYNPNGELLMIFRNDKWDLPKGKMELGENIEATAIREVEEETGIGNLVITSGSQKTYHLYKDHGELRLKETYWYRMASDDDKVLVPQKKEGITEAIWVAAKDIPEKLSNTFGSVRELLS